MTRTVAKRTPMMAAHADTALPQNRPSIPKWQGVITQEDIDRHLKPGPDTAMNKIVDLLFKPKRGM